MQIERINRSELPFFSELHCKLAYQQEVLQGFLGPPFSKEAFGEVMRRKDNQFTADGRSRLVEVLKEQYNRWGIVQNDALTRLLDDSTYTVTTGHQLNLMTGPLFFIYKIAHVIKLAKELKEEYPDKNFVPVYWMATEDHDFEEINHFHLFGKKIEWHTGQSGPVGRYETENWDQWQQEVFGLFPDKKDELEVLFSHYSGENLAEATARLVHYLFGKYGVVIIDADHADLKKLFRKTMAKDLVSSFAFHQVEKTSAKLQEMGFKSQVMPRPVNLFFIEKGHRERLVPEGGKISIEGKGEFSPMELMDLLDSRPELFSPNVVLRPLYQETILPNLAYIGGGGELAYWLQLKGVFEEVEIPFPLLGLRSSLQFVDKNTAGRMGDLGLSFSDFAKRIEDLRKEYVLEKSGNELDFSGEETLLEQLEQSLKYKAEQTDVSLAGMVGGEMARFRKSLDNVRGRLLKAEKQRFENDLNRMEKIQQKLYPQQGLQERYDNFLPMYLKNPDAFIDQIIDVIQPFNPDFIIVAGE